MILNVLATNEYVVHNNGTGISSENLFHDVLEHLTRRANAKWHL